MSFLDHHADHIFLLVALLTGMGLFGRMAILPLHRTMKRMIEFLDDWRGETPRPGTDPRPGVLARLSAIEHEVHENNGTSIKDSVHRTEAGLKRIEAKLKELEAARVLRHDAGDLGPE